MTDSTSSTQPRALVPRRLEHQENLQSLNNWKAVFRNYYRRCQYYGFFLLPTCRWDNSINRGFTAPETTGLKRDPETLAADLDGFLDCIGSFLPFGYVSEKLKAESTGIQSVWDILYELYDVELCTSNFMDYALMKREPEETYKSFFNRLVGFMRQHLPTQAYTSEGVTAPPTGENLTVALLDAVAIHWLLCIDKCLVGIVKTEFASELKTMRLSQMVKTIAKNIDELLARYSNKEQITLVENNSLRAIMPADKSLDSTKDISALVQRVERLETNARRNNRRNNGWNKQQDRGKCSHCTFINKQLGSNLRTDHPSNACGKSRVSISLVESLEDDDHGSPGEVLSEYEGESNKIQASIISSLQTEPHDLPVLTASNYCANCAQNKSICDDNLNPAQLDKALAVSDISSASTANSALCPLLPISAESNTGRKDHDRQSDNYSILANLQTSSTFEWDQIDKSSSPRINVN